MSFDWVQFLEQHRVPYTTAGPNVGRGEVAVKCPFCGAADRSEHMSINLEGRGWMCRRTRGGDHRGRAPERLIRALIGCSREHAAQLVGRPTLPGVGSLLAEFEAARAAPEDDVAPPLKELVEFKKFAGLPSGRPYAQYMRSRGFTEEFLRRASVKAGLRYCTRGPFAGRVVFLVHQEGRLVNWTGRAISPRAGLRYRALSPDPEVAERGGLPRAALSIERCLLWYDELLAGGPLLEVVEGPMDALKLRMLGRRATCLFTNAPSAGQVDLLRELAPRFKRRVVLLDRGAEAEAVLAARALAALNFDAEWLPEGVADPGELPAENFRGAGW